jgi:hypothetical protein
MLLLNLLKLKRKTKKKNKDDKDTESSFDSSLSDSESEKGDTRISDTESAHKGDYDSDDYEEKAHNDIISEKEIARIVAQFQNKEDLQNASRIYDSLLDFVLDAFVRRKASMFNVYVEKGILLSGYSWAKSPQPQVVQSFVLEILLDLSITHSEVERITSVLSDGAGNTPSMKTITDNEASEGTFTKRIFNKLCERLAEVFSEYVRSLETICVNGAFQLDINISFIRKALRNFETRRARNIYSQLFKYLQDVYGYEKKTIDSKLKEQILERTAQETRVQLDCFDIPSHNSNIAAYYSFSNRQRSIGLLKMAHS